MAKNIPIIIGTALIVLLVQMCFLLLSSPYHHHHQQQQNEKEKFHKMLTMQEINNDPPIDESNPDQGKSQMVLFPSWEKDISAAGKISFKSFNLFKHVFNERAQSGVKEEDLRFWYSIEETLHSAKYIVNQEVIVLRFWINELLKERTEKGTCVVVDIGSNGGFFSLLSRKLGCKTVAVDAQPWCLKRLSSSVVMNGFQDNIFIKWGVVSEDPQVVLEVGATKCSGLWSANAKESDYINKESMLQVNVSSLPMKSIIEPLENSDVISIMKIDAEGSEFNIIRSALPLFTTKRLKYIVVEIAPGRVDKLSDTSMLENVLKEIESMDLMFSSLCTEQFSTSETKEVTDKLLNVTSRKELSKCNMYLLHHKNKKIAYP